jgi:curved DNA-binding protein CbpA
VVRAAYRALARRYHPDGWSPNPARMAALNRAYAQVRSHELRAAYDRGRPRLQPVGPGQPARQPAAARPDGLFSRASERNGQTPSSVLTFGRYAGWTIAELARGDPDYLRWLCRHSAGLRYRNEIQQHLGAHPDLNRRASATA